MLKSGKKSWRPTVKASRTPKFRFKLLGFRFYTWFRFRWRQTIEFLPGYDMSASTKKFLEGVPRIWTMNFCVENRTALPDFQPSKEPNSNRKTGEKGQKWNGMRDDSNHLEKSCHERVVKCPISRWKDEYNLITRKKVKMASGAALVFSNGRWTSGSHGRGTRGAACGC